MNFVGPHHPAWKKFCQALGLNPDMVNRLVLTIDADDLVTVDVRLYPEGHQLNDMSDLIEQQFRLVEKQP